MQFKRIKLLFIFFYAFPIYGIDQGIQEIIEFLQEKKAISLQPKIEQCYEGIDYSTKLKKEDVYLLKISNSKNCSTSEKVDLENSQIISSSVELDKESVLRSICKNDWSEFISDKKAFIFQTKLNDKNIFIQKEDDRFYLSECSHGIELQKYLKNSEVKCLKPEVTFAVKKDVELNKRDGSKIKHGEKVRINDLDLASFPIDLKSYNKPFIYFVSKIGTREPEEEVLQLSGHSVYKIKKEEVAPPPSSTSSTSIESRLVNEKNAEKKYDIVFNEALDLVKKDEKNFPISDLQPRDIKEYCPLYNELNVSEKNHFWAHFLATLSKYESGHKPSKPYDEPDLGYQSIGLLQLSDNGVDKNGKEIIRDNSPANNKYGDCSFKNEGNITSVRGNLACGIAIIKNQIFKSNVVSESRPTTKDPANHAGAARYWSVLRDFHIVKGKRVKRPRKEFANDLKNKYAKDLCTDGELKIPEEKLQVSGEDKKNNGSFFGWLSRVLNLKPILPSESDKNGPVEDEVKPSSPSVVLDPSQPFKNEASIVVKGNFPKLDCKEVYGEKSKDDFKWCDPGKIVLDLGHNEAEGSNRTGGFFKGHDHMNEGRLNTVEGMIIKDTINRCLAGKDGKPEVKLSRWPGETHFGTFEKGMNLGSIQPSLGSDGRKRRNYLESLLGSKKEKDNSVFISIHHNAAIGNLSKSGYGTMYFRDKSHPGQTLGVKISKNYNKDLKQSPADFIKFDYKKDRTGVLKTGSDSPTLPRIISESYFMDSAVAKRMVDKYDKEGEYYAFSFERVVEGSNKATPLVPPGESSSYQYKAVEENILAAKGLVKGIFDEYQSQNKCEEIKKKAGDRW